MIYFFLVNPNGRCRGYERFIIGLPGFSQGPSSGPFYNRSHQSGQQIVSGDMKVLMMREGITMVDGKPLLRGPFTHCWDKFLRCV